MLVYESKAIDSVKLIEKFDAMANELAIFEIQESKPNLYLIGIVAQQLGGDALIDLINCYYSPNGARAGFHGFIYYSDSKVFFGKHQDFLITYLNNYINDCYGDDSNIFSICGKDCETMEQFYCNISLCALEIAAREIAEMELLNLVNLINEYKDFK